MNESVFRYVDDPSVALGPDGDALVAWVDQARKDVYLQRFDEQGARILEAPVNVSRTPDVLSWLPRIAGAPGDPDTVYVLWQEIVFSGGSHGGEILFARSTDGGRSFAPPLNLSRSRAGDGKGRLFADYWHNGSLDLAVGPDGAVLAAWTEYEGRLWLARSTDAGASFSEPRRVAGGPGAAPARGPSLAVDDEGHVHLAWTVGEDRAADIRYARSTDAGRSFERQRVGTGPGHADAPKLAVDEAGTVHLAYAESPDGPLRRYDVRYAHRPAGAAGFSEPRIVSTPLPSGVEGAAFPYLALGGDDRIHLAFELFPLRGPHRPSGIGIVHSVDGGDSFTEPARVPGAAPGERAVNGSQQGLLMSKLAARQDSLALVNSRFREGEWSRILLLRGRVREAGARD
jgi:hypothetical protein